MPEQTPRASLRNWKRQWRRFSRYLSERLVLWLLPVVVLGSGAVLWLLGKQVAALYTEMAYQGAALQAKTIEEARQIYASKVVDRLKKHGIEASHEYQTKERTIPLPATLTIEIGERVGKGREIGRAHV